MTTEKGLPPTYRLVRPRYVVYLAVLALAFFVLLPKFVGFGRTVSLLRHAQVSYLLLALGFEISRYLLSTSSTYLLAQMLRRKVPPLPLLETFFAGGAANRIVSTGGAPGMVIRGGFLARRGFPLGSIAILFLIEDVAGFVVGAIISLVGVGALMPVRRSGVFVGGSAGLLALGVLALGSIYLYQHRAQVEQGAHSIVRACSGMTQRLLGRAVYDQAKVQRGVNDFYAGMEAARREPAFTASVLAVNIVRYAAGAAALFCSFYALGWVLSPIALVLLFTSASLVSTISAAPGEAAIMGTGFAVLTLTGVPRDVAMVAMLASRTIAFWLPIPLGLLAFWDLRRRQYL